MLKKTLKQWSMDPEILIKKDKVEDKNALES